MSKSFGPVARFVSALEAMQASLEEMGMEPMRGIVLRSQRELYTLEAYMKHHVSVVYSPAEQEPRERRKTTIAGVEVLTP